MKLGLIADIHGNRPALEAVLNSAPAVDRWVCIGDIVGYYPNVNEVCKTLQSLDICAVRGNHDAYVIGELVAKPERMDLYRTEWTRQHLKSVYHDWLSTLPVELNLSFGHKSLKVRHANPWDEETYLYPDSPLLSKVHLESDAYFVYGHTHYPLLASAGGGFIINPGSVGQPRDYNPRASFSVIDLEAGTIENHRATYDVVSYQRYLSELGWPKPTISILSRSR